MKTTTISIENKTTQCPFCWCEVELKDDKYYCNNCEVEVSEWHELI